MLSLEEARKVDLDFLNKENQRDKLMLYDSLYKEF